ncbi:MAG: hypothetical protein OHK0013_30840 [Sandaracinaceae bacterium]
MRAGRIALPASLLVTLAATVGCEGSLRSTEPGSDAGHPPSFDAWAPPGTDAWDPSSGDVGGTGLDVGAPIDAYTPGSPCATVMCGANQRCDEATRACVCLPGFVDDGAGCSAAPPGDPSARTMAEVCEGWRDMHQTTATAAWTPGPGDCDPGSMPREAIDDTLRRINGFRWLIGLGPVVDDPSAHTRQQSCAVMMYRNGSLDHFPPMSWRCYTADGASGAGSSNLALGTGNSADTIDLYVDDHGVTSLGHRRWVLNGPLGRVGIGFAGNAGCLGVFDRSGSSDRMWTSWPPPGFAPRDTTSAWWSFHSDRGSVADANVRMVRASDGTEVTGMVYRLPEGYGVSAVAWAPTERTVGQRYRVTVTTTSIGEISYEVEIVACP